MHQIVASGLSKLASVPAGGAAPAAGAAAAGGAAAAEAPKEEAKKEESEEEDAVRFAELFLGVGRETESRVSVPSITFERVAVLETYACLWPERLGLALLGGQAQSPDLLTMGPAGHVRWFMQPPAHAQFADVHTSPRLLQDMGFSLFD